MASLALVIPEISDKINENFYRLFERQNFLQILFCFKYGVSVTRILVDFSSGGLRATQTSNWIYVSYYGVWMFPLGVRIKIFRRSSVQQNSSTNFTNLSIKCLSR